MKSLISRMALGAGLDFHIGCTLAYRLWSVVAGAVVIFGLPFWLSGVEQGFYFTFYSLIGLQVFFEMGLNYVVVQFVGHETAHLHFDRAGFLSGPATHLGRMVSLLSLLDRWYKRISVLFFCVVATLGVLFFSRNHELGVTGWLGPWLLLVACSSFSLYVSPFLAVVEGAGFVGQVARMRLLMSVLGYVTMWLLLSLGSGLWAVFLAQFCTAVGGFVWLKLRVPFLSRLFEMFGKPGGEAGVAWRREIFPFQWRIALSWVSGYFIFQLFNPILFFRQGALEAGRAGLALTIFGTLLTVSMSWVNAKAPAIAGMLARREHVGARKLFRSMILRSAAFNFACCLLVLLGGGCLQFLEVRLAERLPGMLALLCIAVATVANHLVSAMAVFMRAHKEDPLMHSSVTMAVLSIGGVYLAAGLGLDAVMAVYAGLAAGIGLPWCWLIFRAYWMVWDQGCTEGSVCNRS